MIFIGKEGVKLSYVGMIKKTLNFDLSNQLTDKSHFSFEDNLLYLLKGTDKVSESMPCQIYCSELSFL